MKGYFDCILIIDGHIEMGKAKSFGGLLFFMSELQPSILHGIFRHAKTGRPLINSSISLSIGLEEAEIEVYNSLKERSSFFSASEIRNIFTGNAATLPPQ